jgi:hypothetical protein
VDFFLFPIFVYEPSFFVRLVLLIVWFLPDFALVYAEDRLADKTNPPSKRMSLNRSQRGNCSTEYNTPLGT